LGSWVSPTQTGRGRRGEEGRGEDGAFARDSRRGVQACRRFRAGVYFLSRRREGV